MLKTAPSRGGLALNLTTLPPVEEAFIPAPICSPRRTGSEATTSASPSERSSLRVRPAILREGGGFHKETFSCKVTERIET